MELVLNKQQKQCILIWYNAFNSELSCAVKCHLYPTYSPLFSLSVAFSNDRVCLGGRGYWMKKGGGGGGKGGGQGYKCNGHPPQML